MLSHLLTAAPAVLHNRLTASPPCTITRIKLILQRGQCNHSLLMLLAKSWAWASLRAALVPLSAPTSTLAVLQLISSAFPPPLSLTFSIPSAAPLSSRLREVAQRLLELPLHSTFNAATALCLALTSDVVVGMSCMILPLCHSISLCSILTRRCSNCFLGRLRMRVVGCIRCTRMQRQRFEWHHERVYCYCYRQQCRLLCVCSTYLMCCR
jgi:hypothetical protein